MEILILEADRVREEAGMHADLITSIDYSYLALQFHLLSLDGAGVVGQLRTLVFIFLEHSGNERHIRKSLQI